MSGRETNLRMWLNPAATNRPVVLIAVIMAMFMAAIEATIVATAMPSIVGDLGGFAQFSWVFSIFLLMQAVTIPIYGKLADLYGRKPVFSFGIVVFLAGSLMCGLARTMNTLIFFRMLQGLGAGAVQPIATTIVGDIYSLEERAKIQGYLSSVWGISSIVGPALGGIMVQYISWSWVFWLNLPLGVLSLLGVLFFLHEGVEKKDHRIDYIGSVLLLFSITIFMVVLIEGGVSWPWSSIQVILLLLAVLAGLLVFAWQENRTDEPMMPMQIWRNRLLAVANVTSLTTGIVMIGVSTFLPTFVQGVMGKSPTVAGFTLAAMSIGWPLASTISGRLMMQLGVRKTSLFGGIGLLAGSLFFVSLQAARGPLWAGIGSFLIGVGMGLASTTFIVAIQSSVDWQMRGVATASNMFMRILGNTVGAALLGGVLNSGLDNFLSRQKTASLTLDVTNTLLDPVKRSQLALPVLKMLQQGLTESLHRVYLGVLIFSIISVILIIFLPTHLEARAEE